MLILFIVIAIIIVILLIIGICCIAKSYKINNILNGSRLWENYPNVFVDNFGYSKNLLHVGIVLITLAIILAVILFFISEFK